MRFRWADIQISFPAKRMIRPVVFCCLIQALAGRALIAQTADFDRARQLLTSGHADEAATMLRRLADADPGNPDMRLNVSVAEFKAGQFDNAANSAAAALKI